MRTYRSCSRKRNPKTCCANYNKCTRKTFCDHCGTAEQVSCGAAIGHDGHPRQVELALARRQNAETILSFFVQESGYICTDVAHYHRRLSSDTLSASKTIFTEHRKETDYSFSDRFFAKTRKTKKNDSLSKPILCMDSFLRYSGAFISQEDANRKETSHACDAGPVLGTRTRIAEMQHFSKGLEFRRSIWRQFANTGTIAESMPVLFSQLSHTGWTPQPSFRLALVSPLRQTSWNDSLERRAKCFCGKLSLISFSTSFSEN